MAEPTKAAAKTAENALNLIAKISKAEKVTGTLKKLLDVGGHLSELTGSFALVGAAIGLIQAFLPDEEFKAIMHQFELLHQEIQNVRDDIKELEKMIKWEDTKLQYAEVVNRIEQAVELCKFIGQNKHDDTKTKHFQARLKEQCENESLLLALRTLIKGLTGRGVLQDNILQSFYDYSWGDRPKLVKLGGQLVQLVCGGLVAEMAYESLVRGKGAAQEIAEMFRDDLKSINRALHAATDRCTENFKTNMQHDLEKVVEETHSRENDEILHILFDKLSKKYDWLRLYCMVCDKKGTDEHALGGSWIGKLNYFDKCAIAFYVDREQSLDHAGRKTEVDSIVRSIGGQGKAHHALDHITGELNKRQIGWWGIACIKRYVHLKGREMSAVYTWDNEKHLTMCVLLK